MNVKEAKIAIGRLLPPCETRVEHILRLIEGQHAFLQLRIRVSSLNRRANQETHVVTRVLEARRMS